MLGPRDVHLGHVVCWHCEATRPGVLQEPWMGPRRKLALRLSLSWEQCAPAGCAELVLEGPGSCPVPCPQSWIGM